MAERGVSRRGPLDSPHVMQPQPSVADTALAFAKALVAGDFAFAHAMLSESLRGELSAGDLKAHYEQMVSYAKAPPDKVEVGQRFGPSERDGVPNSLGWALVNIDSVRPTNAACWLESVGILVFSEADRHAIRQIVWGRP